MDANEYQQESMRTAAPNESLEDSLTAAALGIAGEAGEIVEHIKKYRYHGHDLDYTALAEEIGDLLWYAAYLCSVCNFELEAIMVENVMKLKARYPVAFSQKASRNRNPE